MPRNELTLLIARLKEEIEHFGDHQQGSRDHIESLINELETNIATGTTEDWPAQMVARLREELERYETDHPQVTGILNNIMVTLGGMGI